MTNVLPCIEANILVMCIFGITRTDVSMLITTCIASMLPGIFLTLFISNQNYLDSISQFADCIYDLKRLIQ
jgi:hypothetical protein